MNMRLSSLALLVALAACKDGEKGDPGEPGTDGAAGLDGADGATGTDGIDGEDGASAPAFLTETEWFYEVRYGCEQGYQLTRIGLDDGSDGGTAGDGILQDGEVTDELLSCLGDDVDADGTFNLDDNCVETANANQRDGDFDGVGDACDADTTGVLMWGTTRGNESTTSSLYSYDTADGSATLVGDTGHSIIALQVNPVDGLLYAVTRGYASSDGFDAGGCDSCLVTLDTATGAATLVSELDTGPMPSLAFMPDGTAYGWTESGDDLVEIDTASGTTTYTGIGRSSSGHSMGATSDGTLYWMRSSTLYEVGLDDTTLTQLSYVWDDFEGGGGGRIRGDVSADGEFWIGGDGYSTIGVVDMTATDGPTAIAAWPQPDGARFHTMTFQD